MTAQFDKRAFLAIAVLVLAISVKHFQITTTLLYWGAINNTVMETIIFCGIQATGKTTFFKERF